MTDLGSIDNLTIDGVNYVVAEQSDEIQLAVRKYEDWRDRLAVAQDEVTLVGAALRDLGAQIVAAIRAEEERAEQQRAAEAVAGDDGEPEIQADPADTLVVDDA